MQLAHFYHRHHLHRLAKHPDFRFFELAIWLHTLARSLIAVFVPIILYKTGYSITSILVFYLIFNLIDVPLNFPVETLIRKIGARKGIILGTIATILFFAIFGILPPNNWPLLILLAFLAASYDTLFWISHIYIFIESNRQGLETGKSVGLLETVRKLANIMGPIAGAAILFFGGKIPLSLVSIIIFGLSIIPLYKMRHVRDIPAGKPVPIKKFFSETKEKKDYLSMAIWGVHNEVDEMLWPLFIFTIFGTLESVAAVPVVVSLGTVFSYLAGKLSKRFENKMIILGCLVVAAAWILRMSIQSAGLYYATVFLVGIFSLLIIIPIDVSVTSRGLKVGSLSSATYRNAASMILRIPLYIILILLVEVFKVSFGLAASSLFLIILVVLLFQAKISKNAV